MSANRTEQCASPAFASRERASASIARLASMPSPSFTRGPSSSSTRPVPVPMSSNRPPCPSGTSASSHSSIEAAGSPIARISSQSAPLRWKLSDAVRARSDSTRAACRRSAAIVGSSSATLASSSRVSAPASPVGTANHTFAPSRTRSSRPASQSSFRWRDSRGCDWPRISVNSDTQNAPRPARARMRSRVGSAAARRAVSRASIGLYLT